MPESIIRIPDHSADLARILAKLEDLEKQVQELKAPPVSPYMTFREAMEYHRVKHRDTMTKRLRAAGVKPVKKSGGKLLYLKTEIKRI